MPRTKTITLYRFNELSDKAKARARTWYRDASAGDNYFAEPVIEKAVCMAGIIGIDIQTHAVKLRNGTTRRDPSIWWSGFYSQGDGASFEGSYLYRKGAHRRIREEAPTDTELHRITDELCSVQKRYNYSLTASVTHRGHYSHKIQIDRNSGPNEINGDDMKAVEELLRAFMRWIYQQLQAAYKYENADAQIDETIRANEYEFDVDGDRTS